MNDALQPDRYPDEGLQPSWRYIPSDHPCGVWLRWACNRINLGWGFLAGAVCPFPSSTNPFMSELIFSRKSTPCQPNLFIMLLSLLSGHSRNVSCFTFFFLRQAAWTRQKVAQWLLQVSSLKKGSIEIALPTPAAVSSCRNVIYRWDSCFVDLTHQNICMVLRDGLYRAVSWCRL